MSLDAQAPRESDVYENEQLRRLNDKLRRELGESVLAALEDPAVVEIMLNPDGTLWEDRHGCGMRPIGSMTKVRAMNLVCTVAGMLGLEARAETPVVEGELPLDGSRFEGVIPPIVERPIFAIRKRPLLVYTLDDYERKGIMTAAQRQVIDAQLRLRRNLLVVGSTGSGKTTLCNALLHRIAELDPNTRIAILEDTRELQCPAANKFPLRTSESVDMTKLLRACMRLRPDRIVVGEVRDKAALALLKAWNTGHDGGLSTVHSDSPYGGLIRIEQLVQEANVPPVRAVIAQAINCIVSIQRTNAEPGRKVEQIAVLKGGSEDVYDLEFF